MWAANRKINKVRKQKARKLKTRRLDDCNKKEESSESYIAADRKIDDIFGHKVRQIQIVRQLKILESRVRKKGREWSWIEKG